VDLAVGVHVITLTVTDNEDMQGADDVQITVSEVNNPPSAEPDAAATDEDTPANVAVLAGSPADSDPDGDPLTVVSCESDGTTQGAVALNGNSCAYDPRGAFESLQVGGSATDTFTYTITDGELTDSATVTVMVNGVNDAPSAADDSQTTDEGVPATVAVLANDSDPESDPLTVASVADPAGGSASTDGTTVTYTPDPGFAGSDAFTYTVSDGNGGAAAASISVTVTPAAATTMHVAGLNLTATRWWWWWYSRVTITIEDGSGSPVPDATVSGSFSHAISGDISCTTNGAGQCGRTSALILDRSKSITFTVTDVTHATLAYQPGDNVATSVTANKP
jgi:VCBS repeat-containing protein